MPTRAEMRERVAAAWETERIAARNEGRRPTAARVALIADVSTGTASRHAPRWYKPKTGGHAGIALGPKDATLERVRYAIQLYNRGMDYAEIGAALDPPVTRQAVQQMFQRYAQ